jgi:hypothetical protein
VVRNPQHRIHNKFHLLRRHVVRKADAHKSGPKLCAMGWNSHTFADSALVVRSVQESTTECAGEATFMGRGMPVFPWAESGQQGGKGEGYTHLARAGWLVCVYKRRGKSRARSVQSGEGVRRGAGGGGGGGGDPASRTSSSWYDRQSSSAADCLGVMPRRLRPYGPAHRQPPRLCTMGVGRNRAPCTTGSDPRQGCTTPPHGKPEGLLKGNIQSPTHYYRTASNASGSTH